MSVSLSVFSKSVGTGLLDGPPKTGTVFGISEGNSFGKNGSVRFDRLSAMQYCPMGQYCWTVREAGPYGVTD